MAITCMGSSTDTTPGAGAPLPAAPRPSGCPIHAIGSLSGGVAVFLYGLVCYAAFFVTLLYAIGFVGNWFVPKSIDTGEPGAAVPSLLINTALLSIFVVQHTVMARPAFKRRWTRIIPASIERSTFVLAASASLALMMWLWRPLPQVVWEVQSAAAWWALTAVSAIGFAIVLLSSFMVNHFDLFGLRQVWLRLRGRAYSPVGFRLIGLYKLVRHPLMVGFLIGFWATPKMTVGHLFFALMVSAYIFFGTWMEERDLVAEHGENYLDYRRRVRGFLPIPRRA